MAFFFFFFFFFLPGISSRTRTIAHFLPSLRSRHEDWVEKIAIFLPPFFFCPRNSRRASRILPFFLLSTQPKNGPFFFTIFAHVSPFHKRGEGGPFFFFFFFFPWPYTKNRITAPFFFFFFLINRTEKAFPKFFFLDRSTP